MSRLLPSAFIVDHLGSFAGFYLEDGSPPRPLFPLETAIRMAAAWAELAVPEGLPPREAEYDEAADAFRFYDPGTDEWHVWEAEQHGSVRLYPIGRDAWTWRLRGDIDT